MPTWPVPGLDPAVVGLVPFYPAWQESREQGGSDGGTQTNKQTPHTLYPPISLEAHLNRSAFFKKGEQVGHWPRKEAWVGKDKRASEKEKQRRTE